MKQGSSNTGPYHAPYWPTAAPKISSNASNGTGYVAGKWACNITDINALVDEYNHQINFNPNSTNDVDVLNIKRIQTNVSTGALSPEWKENTPTLVTPFNDDFKSV